MSTHSEYLYIDARDLSFASNFTLNINDKILSIEKELREYKTMLEVIRKYQMEIDRLKDKIAFYEKAMERCGKLAELKAVGENIELRNKIAELQTKIEVEKSKPEEKTETIVDMAPGIVSKVAKMQKTESPSGTGYRIVDTNLMKLD